MRVKFRKRIAELLNKNDGQKSLNSEQTIEELERRYYEDIAAKVLKVAGTANSVAGAAVDPHRRKFNWTLGNSVLYAFNLLTTIGLFVL